MCDVTRSRRMMPLHDHVPSCAIENPVKWTATLKKLFQKGSRGVQDHTTWHT